jgi:hypothetical protein
MDRQQPAGLKISDRIAPARKVPREVIGNLREAVIVDEHVGPNDIVLNDSLIEIQDYDNSG